MSARRPSASSRSIFFLLASFIGCVLSTTVVPATANATPQAAQDDAAAGKALFTGDTKLQNGGPPCATCHSVATLAFPKGGSMGPDLTREYSKLGPEGMHYALRTLYFPAMNALFLKHQLTPQEELGLSAFFQPADRAQPGIDMTTILGILAIAGFGLLMAATWVAGRGRVHSVRRALLKRAGLDEEKP